MTLNKVSEDGRKEAVGGKIMTFPGTSKRQPAVSMIWSRVRSSTQSRFSKQKYKSMLTTEKNRELLKCLFGIFVFHSCRKG